MLRACLAVLSGLVVAGFEAPPEDVRGWQFVRSLPIGARQQAIASVTAPEPVRDGATSLRFEVRPGDCSRGRHGWDDCANDRERAELKQTGYQHAGERWWYRFSLYVPRDFAGIWPAKVAFAQFHQEGAKPALMVQHRKGGLWLDIHDAHKTVRLIELVSPADLPGRWHDLVLAIDWRRDRRGRVRAWVDGAARADYRGATMNADQVYFKFGLYRSHLSRNPGAGGIVQTVYFDRLARGATARSVGFTDK